MMREHNQGRRDRHDAVGRSSPASSIDGGHGAAQRPSPSSWRSWRKKRTTIIMTDDDDDEECDDPVQLPSPSPRR
ncbi:MAG: hypothetical protein ACLU3I_00335 [Acutalibacteraceae bacterium]